MSLRPGDPNRLGATADADGTRFAVYSSVAERVELCLFDAAGAQRCFDMPECTNGVWHGYLPACSPGQRYGYRVHGPWDPGAGLRCNPAKLLIDPYAREITGELDWQGPVFDYQRGTGSVDRRCDQDNAGFVPLSVVTATNGAAVQHQPIPWSDTLLYELNVRGFTMRHPAVAEADKGRFAGLQTTQVIDYLKSLGISSVELMPTLAFVDEEHLSSKGLRNYWGYNTINFFAPAPRYGTPQALRTMVARLHDAGLEVILDVAYNHTGESDTFGPVLSFRGLDNSNYYRTASDDPSTYINDTGCGNTIDADSPIVQRMIRDSLNYLHADVGFDGFRFDLAPILGRHRQGFSKFHPLLQAITEEPTLQSAKLIAEPWDPGPGGYQLGNFPARWGEWNDRYRDTVRSFWRGDAGSSGAVAQSIHGSANIFETADRPPSSSVNFIAAHDGFTLMDTVSYEARHNHANGEDNRDGHAHNISRNYGVEGPTDDPLIISLRRRQRLNMLATLLFSQGTPMLLAGDEIGQTQAGNNNAYAQDNETTWLDWDALAQDPEFQQSVRELIALRRTEPLLRQDCYVHYSDANSDRRFLWYNTAGQEKQDHEWQDSRAFTAVVSDQEAAVALVINGSEQDLDMTLPQSNQWQTRFTSSRLPNDEALSGVVPLESFSIAIATSRPES